MASRPRADANRPPVKVRARKQAGRPQESNEPLLLQVSAPFAEFIRKLVDDAKRRGDRTNGTLGRAVAARFGFDAKGQRMSPTSGEP